MMGRSTNVRGFRRQAVFVVSPRRTESGTRGALASCPARVSGWRWTSNFFSAGSDTPPVSQNLAFRSEFMTHDELLYDGPRLQWRGKASFGPPRDSPGANRQPSNAIAKAGPFPRADTSSGSARKRVSRHLRKIAGFRRPGISRGFRPETRQALASPTGPSGGKTGSD